MPATVIVNNLTVVHKASGGTSVAGPDVCKTPTPGGPVPVPYVNTALSRHTAKGSRNVRVDGHPIMLKSSHFSTSTGDEPGTLGGVVSGKFKGKAYPRMYSLDVKVEGQNVFRLGDMMLQNGGSPTNAAGIETQANAVAAGTDPTKAELVEMRWSRTELCCGDPVSLTVTTRNADPGQVVEVRVERSDLKPAPALGVLAAEVHGDRGQRRWVSRWTSLFRPKVPAIAVQATLKGPRASSNALEFRAPTPAKQLIGPYEMTAPQYVDPTETGNYEANGEYFGWDVCYELEITQGRLWVRRKLDFNVRTGRFNPTPASWRGWKQQIEAVWDHRFYLHRVGCRRRADCDCSLIGCCKYPVRVVALRGPGHGKQVDLFLGAPKAENWGKLDLWWYSHTWWHGVGDAPDSVRAHEFGHLIGCYDEYPAGACHPSRRWANGGDSLMNSGSTLYPRHIEDFVAWFLDHAGGIVGDCEVVAVR